ncbi:MAG TPA: PilX N-terminal domain-containing pilus assembly protein, partial [Blastocatellia bacterium]|nr:PilX N-terminal domain-containing pilus assembly protein [Blastocatellia bacterium]
MDRVRRSVPALSFKTRRASGSRKPCEQPAGGPNRRSDESGVALIAVLLIMSLLLMLGLAVTFSSVSDKFVTSNFKNVTSGFYAAEAGIQNLHRMLRSDRFVLASLPEPVVIRTGEPTLNERDFTTAAERALNLKEKFPNNAAYETKIKIKSINVPYPATDDNPSHRSRRVTYINRLYPRLGQIEPYSVS